MTSNQSEAVRPRLSVGVLTFNEEGLIAECLRSAAFADEVVVVDAGSTDSTVEIAQSLGAIVYRYPDWRGFAVQRNRLLQHVHGDFVFFLDADEVMSPEFQRELQCIVAQADHHAVWRLRWRLVAFGKCLPRTMSQTTVERFFPRGLIDRFEGVVHEEAILNRQNVPRKTMKNLLLHHTNTSVRASLAKMVQYAMLGATKRKLQGRKGGVLRGLASAFAAFFRFYVVRLGFLGGGSGFLYSLFKALESFFRYAALRYDYDSLTDQVQR